MPFGFLAIYAVVVFVIARRTQPDQPRWYAPVVTMIAVAFFGGAWAAIAAFSA